MNPKQVNRNLSRINKFRLRSLCLVGLKVFQVKRKWRKATHYSLIQISILTHSPLRINLFSTLVLHPTNRQIKKQTRKHPNHLYSTIHPQITRQQLPLSNQPHNNKSPKKLKRLKSRSSQSQLNKQKTHLVLFSVNP